MQFLRSLANVPADFAGCAVSIGNFDALHLGHQGLIERLQQVAKAQAVPSLLMLFEPQPLEFFQGSHAPVRLAGLRDKLLAISASKQIDYVLCVPFNQALSKLSATQFIEQVLWQKLRLQHLIIGDDFKFGYQRKGNFDTLKQAGLKFGFKVEDTKTISWQHERVSSTRIRQALANNQLDLVTQLLNRPYSMSGRVMYGRQLARTLNSPTANIAIRRSRLPITGVFAVDVYHQESRQSFKGVANLGVKPTVTTVPEPSLEVHLFDFSGNLYHQHLQVSFLHKLRDEQKFNNINELKIAIARDQAQARDFFNHLNTN